MKKKYLVNMEGEQRHAIVARKGSDTEISVDDGPLSPVNYRPVLQGKAISIKHGGRLHLVHITGLDNQGSVAVTVNGRPVSLAVLDELKAQALESLGGGALDGTISADIPGLVIDIKVSEGQEVLAGDPVIVVEAMKMQNELCASVDGVVTSIPVEAGQAVNPGDRLVIIEARDAD